ncbi:MAG: SGNH/GDSL hydrolase family protein [Spirochaetes bacterium]|nr:SGNH/GDSL hydrolase family protein [Spirochaetota bacterium]
MAEPTVLDWYDIRDWGVEGKGYDDTLRYYDRLPPKAESMVPKVVWDLSRTATGMCAWFETDASEIHAKWVLGSPQINEMNFPAAGFSGLDLYADDNGSLRWAGAGHLVKDQRPEQCLISGMAGNNRRYCIYLPIRNPLESAAIGIPKGSRFTPVPPRKSKPVVFYGTSIVHGAYASHSGMIHPSIIGRRLHTPVINLGFSGNAKMERALAELIAEIDASVYVIDALPNMDMALVQERADVFMRTLHKLRPHIPAVYIEDRPLTNWWLRPATIISQEAKWREFRRIYDNVRADGGYMHYIEGRALFGTDCEASLDTSHPSDLGFMRMADIIEPVIRSLI